MGYQTTERSSLISVSSTLRLIHDSTQTDSPTQADDHLLEVLKYCKGIAAAQNLQEYNILQNNGKLAHQVVPHVHFHVIPKTSQDDGLQIGWPTQKADMDELKKYCEEM